MRTPRRGNLVAPIYATAITRITGDFAGTRRYVAPLWIVVVLVVYTAATGRERIYVRLERAAMVGTELASSGVARGAEFDRGALALGDEVQLTARVRFARNYGDPGEFDARRRSWRAGGVDVMMTAPKKSFATPASGIIGHDTRFPSARIDSIRRVSGRLSIATSTVTSAPELRARVIGDRGNIRDGPRQQFAVISTAT